MPFRSSRYLFTFFFYCQNLFCKVSSSDYLVCVFFGSLFNVVQIFFYCFGCLFLVFECLRNWKCNVFSCILFSTVDVCIF